MSALSAFIAGFLAAAIVAFLASLMMPPTAFRADKGRQRCAVLLLAVMAGGIVVVSQDRGEKILSIKQESLVQKFK